MRDGRTSSRQPLARRLMLLALALSIAALDQITKSIAVGHLTAGKPVGVLGSVLSLELVHNPGSAFSVSVLSGPVLVVLYAAVLIAAVTAMVRISDTRMATVVAVLVGGVAGNLVDRLLRSPSVLHGHVVDWISVTHWPVFNIADSAICGAVALGAILVLRPVRTGPLPTAGGSHSE